MSDSISNFVTAIRNASTARKAECVTPYSKVRLAIAEILRSEGYILDVKEGTDDRGFKTIVMVMKYVDEQPALNDIQRHSKSGRRLYYGATEIPRTLGGLGVGILTTSKGIMRDRDARRENVGGELLCQVW